MKINPGIGMWSQDITVEEAAKILDLSPRTVRHHCRAGHLRFRSIKTIGGFTALMLLDRKEVSAFEPAKPGRPKQIDREPKI